MDIRETYIEIAGFLCTSGGAYTNYDAPTFRDIIDALLDRRYRITRHDNGTIKSVTTWWMIHEKDLEEIKRGGKPADISTGRIVYVADHAGKGAIPDLVKFIKTTIGRKGVCWHHRFKHADSFVYYPDKEGIHA